MNTPSRAMNREVLSERPSFLVSKHIKIAVVAIALAITAGCIYAGKAGNALHAIPAIKTMNTNAALSVRSLHTEREHGYITLVGSTCNISSRTLKNVEAVGEFFDSNGHICAVESAMLEFPGLRPGGDSSFSIIVSDHPEITSYRVLFRNISGRAINARENGGR